MIKRVYLSETAPASVSFRRSRETLMQLNLDFKHELNLYHTCSINSSRPLSGEALCSTACFATIPISIIPIFRHISSHRDATTALHPVDYLSVSHITVAAVLSCWSKAEGDVPAALIRATEIPKILTVLYCGATVGGEQL